MKTIPLLTALITICVFPLLGTSVRLVSDACPICQKESHYTALMSFSMYGEPSRDFLDSPLFTFSGPRICPWDLYASQFNDWGIEDPDRVLEIQKRLKGKNLVINLTPEEGKWIDKIRAYKKQDDLLGFREIWWFRTLQAPGSTDDEITMVMKLFMLCDFRHEESLFSDLREIYRLELLELFQKRMSEKDAPREVKLRCQYLHAEFLRKGLQTKEALKEFTELDQLLAAIPEKEREQYEPVVTWTKEQRLQLILKVADLEGLMAKIKTPLVNPFRVEEAPPEDSWLEHRWAAEELWSRCVRGDKEALEQCWNLLKRDPVNLLALGETINDPSLDLISKFDLRWEKWRQELATQLKDGKIPEGVKTEVNQERNLNILKSLLGGGRANYLIEAEGEADTPEGRLRAALTLIDKGSETEAAKAAELALKELRSLDWKKAKEEDMFDYPLQYLSRSFSKSKKRFFKQFEESLKEPWKDPFFREMTRLWLGKADALARLEQTEALKTKLKYPGFGPTQMVYFHLETQKNPAWRERCIGDLRNLEMLNDRVFSYAQAVMNQDLETVLLERHQSLSDLLAKDPDPRMDLSRYDASDIETWWRNSQLIKIPLRIAK